MLKTHLVIDLTITVSEGDPGVFVGTMEECQDFVAKQSDYFTYEIVPMTKKEIEKYPDNETYLKSHRIP